MTTQFKIRKPCKRCGDPRRYASGSGQCPTCVKRLAEQYRAKLNAPSKARRERARAARGNPLDITRRQQARLKGHAPPPLERDCPPRPADGRCQDCGKKAKLGIHHDHITGAFGGWLCQKCNLKPERTIRRPADKLAVEVATEARRLKLKP
jgi:hypothetical protein